MGTWNVINQSEIEFNRIESEYYQSKFITAKKIAGNKSLKYFGVKIFHPAEVKRIYSDTGTLQIVLAQNVRDNVMDWSTKKLMHQSMYSLISRNKLVEGDVLVTRSGANYGQTSVVTIETKNSDLFACADVLIVKPNIIGGSLLSTFLNTEVGKLLMVRGVYGAGQPHVAPHYIGHITFPEFLLDYKGEIEEIIYKSRTLQEQSQTFYQQATDLLEQELGLDKITFEKPKSYVANFSEVVSSHRISSYFYEPKYRQLENLLQNFETSSLRKLINGFSTGFAFAKKHITKQRTDAPLIKIANIKLMDIDIQSSDFINDLGKQIGKNEIVNTGDILIGMSGSVGTSAVIREKIYAFINQRILRINSLGIINPEYLALVINSLIGKMQFEKYGTGGVQVNISPRDMLNIKIPRLGIVEDEISRLITKSFEARKESKRLLEQAKNRVEQLIEEAAGK